MPPKYGLRKRKAADEGENSDQPRVSDFRKRGRKAFVTPELIDCSSKFNFYFSQFKLQIEFRILQIVRNMHRKTEHLKFCDFTSFFGVRFLRTLHELHVM